MRDKRWSISFPGEFGQDVVETWREDQIIKSYYTYWSTKMIENGRISDISRERCIEDWCVVHWAWENFENVLPGPEKIPAESE